MNSLDTVVGKSVFIQLVWLQVVKMDRVLVWVFLIFLSVDNSLQFPNGAPASRCNSLEPSHSGAVSQTFPSPYEIIPLTDKIGNGQTLRLIIHTSQLHQSFKGFMFQARTVSDPFAVVGQFQQAEGYEVVFRDCSSSRSTVTNANNNLNTTLLFEWIAPRDFVGNVKFQ